MAVLLNWSSEDIHNKNFPDMVKTLRQGSEAAVAAAGNLIRKFD